MPLNLFLPAGSTSPWPLVCFEWLQRPENILAGHSTWIDYRPSDRRKAVRILHHKTGVMVWMALGIRLVQVCHSDLSALLAMEKGA